MKGYYLSSKDRFETFIDVIESNTGTHRINWTQPRDDRTFHGQWVYTDRQQAEQDAERFKKMPFVSSAWVEEREPND